MIRRMSLLSLLLSGAMLQMAPVQTAEAGGFWGWSCDNQTVTSYWEENIFGNELTGRGTLCSTPWGLWSSMGVKGLTAGNAYTVWYVYIDKPEDCVNFPLTPQTADIPFDEPIGYAGGCGLADFFTEELDDSGQPFLNPLVVYGRMDAAVAGHRRNTRFAGDIRDFVPSSGSQIWMFIFGHGPADTTDNRQLARQLLTPEDPVSGVPHLGIAGRPFGYPAGVMVFDMP